MNADGQFVFCRSPFLGRRNSAQQQDLRINSVLSQLHPLLHRSHRKMTNSEILQKLRNSDGAMSVCLGFHYAAHIHARPTDVPANLLQVLFQTGKGDFCPAGPNAGREVGTHASLRFSNFVYSPRKTNLACPVGPFRCFPIITSTIRSSPKSSESSERMEGL